MTDTKGDDLIKRLQRFAQGCRGSMWQSRDETIRLCDEAARALTEARAERDAHVAAALEAARQLAHKDADRATAEGAIHHAMGALYVAEAIARLMTPNASTALADLLTRERAEARKEAIKAAAKVADSLFYPDETKTSARIRDAISALAIQTKEGE